MKHSSCVVLYLKDTEKWKQFTTCRNAFCTIGTLCCISKILKNESNSQHASRHLHKRVSCVVSKRYWKMKAIHNTSTPFKVPDLVVLYLKDTEKWKQFTTTRPNSLFLYRLCCISKILKNESNSQRKVSVMKSNPGCVVSQRYWKMKAIHNVV